MMKFAVFTQAEKEIVGNISKLIFSVAIAAVSIATPALAAHKGNPFSAHHNGYVTRSSLGRGVYNFAPVAPSVYESGGSPAFTSTPRDPRSWVGDPAGRPYVYVPGMAEGP
jgi:hypothetical protein